MAQRLGGYSLALLILAGQFKGHPALEWMGWDLTLVAAVIVVLFSVAAAFSMGHLRRTILIPIALWVALLPTIALVSPTPYGQTKITTLFTITFALALAPYFLLRTDKQRRGFLHGLVVGGLISAVDVMTGGQNAELYGRVAAEGTDTIGTARIAMSGAIVLAVLALSRKNAKSTRIISVMLAGALAVVALMTGSRGPALAAAIALLGAAALTPMFKKHRVRSLVGIGIIGAIAVFVVAREGSAGYSRILSFLNGESDTSTNARTALWESAWSGIQQNPLGFGWGAFADLGGRNTYPHNLLLEVGFEIGVVAAVAVAIVLISALVSSARRATNPVGVAYFALLIFATFNAMVSSDINGSRMLVVVLFASWVVARRPHAESPVEPDQTRPATVQQGSVRTRQLG